MAESKQESRDKMWKFVKGFAEKSGTTMHPNPAVTEAVVNGLAMHIDELGKPLCPCNFYKDKQVTYEEAVKILKKENNEDSTFNIIGKKSIQAAIEAGLITKNDFATVDNIPFTLILL